MRVKETEADDYGLTHVRVQQVVHGVPVFGAESAVHLNRTGAVYAYGGDVYPLAAGVDTTPALSGDAAIFAAKADLGADVVYRDANSTKMADDFGNEAADWSPTADLVVFPHDGRYVLAYHVRLFVDEPAPANWEVFVDARTGAVVHRFNSIDTAHDFIIVEQAPSLGEAHRCDRMVATHPVAAYDKGEPIFREAKARKRGKLQDRDVLAIAGPPCERLARGGPIIIGAPQRPVISPGHHLTDHRLHIG